MMALANSHHVLVVQILLLVTMIQYATIEDGSCIIPVPNCQACNGTNDGLVIVDADGDGVCNADEISGCTDATASNYDPAATDEDGSCTYAGVPACDGVTGGLEDVIVETYYISDSNDATDTDGGSLAAGSTTYRIYIDMAPGYELQAVYGNNDHELRIETTTEFFNNVDRGEILGSNIPDNRIDENTVALDSWVTMGGATTLRQGLLKAEDTNGSLVGGANNDGGSAGIAGGLLVNADPLAGIPLTTQDGLINVAGPSVTVVGLDLSTFDNVNSATPFVSTGGAWSVLEGVQGNTPSNRVLVAQITTDGDLSFTLNVQLGTPDGDTEQYVASSPINNERVCSQLTFPELVIVPGCIDPTACNFNAAANEDDGSCTYPGCMDATACNYDMTAGCDDGSCVLPDGCTNPLACNYDASALCDDGSCVLDTAAPTISFADGALLPGITGPSSSQTPYFLPSKSGVQFTSVLTVGDIIGGYDAVGIMDGLGAYDNGDGTFTVLINHEINNTLGVVRDHGFIGSFISKWVINKADLSVVSGGDLIQDAFEWSTLSNSYVPLAAPISRLCSADLPLASALFNTLSGNGSTERIFLSGEESGNNGRQFAHVVTGPDAGKSFELPFLGNASWENTVANPVMQDKTIVAETDDNTTNGQVYVYVGTKTNVGTEVEKAGLSGGLLYGIQISGLPSELDGSIPADGTPFTMVNLGAVQNLDGNTLNTNSIASGVTNFKRPEDGAWDSTDPSVFYFVTTNSFSAPSRMWKLTFTDITNPELGGTASVVLDGTEGQRMMDNIGVDVFGNVLIQEDPGNNAYLGRVWEYRPSTDSFIEVATHDPARFAVGGPSFLTQDEESSGVIDISSILGPGMFLVDVQAHYSIPGELVEGGQLLVMYNANAVTGAYDAPETVYANTNSGCSAINVDLGTPITSDDCAVVSVANDAPATFPTGTTLVTWTVTDVVGNITTGVQTVIVSDETVPTITAPAAVSVAADGSCTASGVVLGSPVTADNCGVASVTNNAPLVFPLGATVVVWTVTDTNGNTASANQTVTVTGTQVTYYADVDGDGYGDLNSSTMSCAPVVGFVLDNTDCDDNNFDVNPGVAEIPCNNIDDDCDGSIDNGVTSGCTDPTACNYDMTAGCDDGSCTYAPCIANDVPAGAIALTVTPLGSCNPMMADLTGASDSPESSSIGADLWYAVTAVTPGLRVEVLDVNPQDLKVEVLDAALNSVDLENTVAGNGSEILNFGGLTPGATYYISVTGSTGAFSICAQWIQDSECDYGSGPYDLCATFKADWIGAAGYAFEFTSSSMVTYSYEKAAALQPSTFVKLSDAGLLWNDTYTVNCIAYYNLTNGSGAIEKVYVNSGSPCQIIVNPAPTMVLRPSDNCANFGPHLLGQTIAGQPFICGAVDYEWEFTRTDVAELPIYKIRGAANRFLQLLTVPGLVAGATYDVRVRPIFTSGPGSFGAADCITIVGVVAMTAQDGPVNEMEAERVEVSGIEAGLYPNPNTGSMININLTGVTSEVVNVDVLDQAGRVVFAGQYTVNNGSLNGTITFDQQLAGGVYMMKFTMDGESRTERFVVTR
jgi:hypothetical protein